LAKVEGGTVEEHQLRLDGLREKLRKFRANRVPPGLDDKCLAGWNGLMVSALCRAWQVFGAEEYLESARRAARFFLSPEMWNAETGALKRVWCKGRVSVDAVLEDYAYLLGGVLDLLECDGSEEWREAALALAVAILRDFEDRERGGFYSVRAGDSLLVSRPRDDQDGALPAAGAMAAQGLARLWHLTGREDFRQAAERAIRCEATKANRYPAAFASVIRAAQILSEKTPVICIHGAGDEKAGRELYETAVRTYLPNRIVLRADRTGATGLAVAEGRTVAAQPTAHVCYASTCLQPMNMAAELRLALESLR
jgi:uncharacterized protein YyaL (SSP411 family)